MRCRREKVIALAARSRVSPGHDPVGKLYNANIHCSRRFRLFFPREIAMTMMNARQHRDGLAKRKTGGGEASAADSGSPTRGRPCLI
jgi:hypothetical protein